MSRSAQAGALGLGRGEELEAWWPRALRHLIAGTPPPAAAGCAAAAGVSIRFCAVDVWRPAMALALASLGVPVEEDPTLGDEAHWAMELRDAGDFPPSPAL